MEFGRSDWNSKLIDLFFANSRLVLLILIGITIGGLFALLNLQREGFPAVSVKVVGVTTIYPGASATEVESQVTKLVETAVSKADKVDEVSSTSQNSFSSVVVTLDQSADLDVAITDIQSKVAGIESELPDSVESPSVQTFASFGDDFIVGLVGDKPLSELNNLSDKIAEEINSVSGVSRVKELQEINQRLLISYDPVKLAANNLTIVQIEQIIKGSNLDFPLGTFDVDNKKQALVVIGAFESKEDFENQIVGVGPVGQILKIKDVAAVTSADDSQDSIHRVGVKEEGLLVSRPGILLGISKESDKDVIVLKEKLDEKIAQLRSENLIPAGVSLNFLSDQSESTKEQVDEIISGAIGDRNTFYLLGGIQLVLLFMLLFVNWRAALVAASAIPISFLFTLLFLYLTNTNLNTLVLFSLVLVLGLIVDPAIVMVESIQRYFDLGASSKQAVFATGRRYGAGLFIAVLTSVIVFVPFGTISGVFGDIIKYIPLTVVPALVASYLVPIAIIPFLASRILKKKPNAVVKDEAEDIWLPGRYMVTFNSWVLGKLWRKLLVLVVAVVLIVSSTLLIVSGKIPVVQFSSPEDNPYLQVNVTFPKGTTVETQNFTAKEIESILVGEGGIANFFYQTQGRGEASIFVTLEPVEDRSEGDRSKRILERLESEFENFDKAVVSVAELSVGPPTQEYQIQTQLFASDLDTLEKAAISVGDFLRKNDKVAKVDDAFTGKGEPQIRIIFDKAKLSSNGLSAFEASLFLKAQLEEKQITKFEDNTIDRSIEVFLAPDEATLPSTISQIQNLSLVSRTGQLVTLGSVASVQATTTLDQINRLDSKRYVNVRASLKDSNDLVKIQQELDNFLSDSKLKELGIESVGNRGEVDDIAQSLEELFFALIAAIFLTYLVMVLQFRSFSQPVIMLFTIPLSLIGVLPALYLVNGQLGFLEILGFTILVGIVENVAIFLIDYANQLVKEKNMSLKEAIILSTGVRFRPIILTKLVALGGLLPLAIFSPFWRGLSAVIIGGILVSGFLSMTIIPIFYTWFGAIRAKVHSKIS